MAAELMQGTFSLLPQRAHGRTPCERARVLGGL